jgi:hypothetical protein
MAPALTSLKDEPSGSIINEQFEQSGRGDMQIGGDAIMLKGESLIRPSTGDQSKGRLARYPSLNHLQLLLAQLKGDETQNAYTPRPVAEHLTGLFE